MCTPRAAAARQVRANVAASPAWNPHATLALVTTSSIASSSPSRHTPKLSPRSALRSTVTTNASLGPYGRGPPVLRHELVERTPERPLIDLQCRPVRELRYGPKAQDRDRLRIVGHRQQLGQLERVEHRPPAHAEAFGASGA